MTSGVQSMGDEALSGILDKIRGYSPDQFTPDNDPYGEHDFGSIEYRGTKLFWKIDYYDRRLEYHSEDPADPIRTQRVMTIMRSDEY